MPRQIAAESVDGVTGVVDTVDTGYSAAYTIAHGQTRTLTIGAWWRISKSAGGEPCQDPITNIDEVLVPLRGGDLRVAVNPLWVEVCTTPASTSITMDTGYQPAPTDGAVSTNPG